MGYFYTGFDYKNRKNGYFKIGETGQKNLGSRLSNIRQYDSFQCLGYIELINETLSERRLVESYVRVMMERIPELTQTQNDHFLYTIESKERKYEQAQEYAEQALHHARCACQLFSIQFKEGTKVFKRS